MSIFNKNKNQPAANSDEPKKEAVRPVKAEAKSAKADKPQVKLDKEKKHEILNKKNLYGVLIQPLVSERSTALLALNKYVFRVSPAANKIRVAQAIQARYGVKPQSVNIISLQGKKVRYGRTRGQTSAWKKAIVTLAPGQTIDLQEGV